MKAIREEEEKVFLISFSGQIRGVCESALAQYSYIKISSVTKV
jgi:hypothetical protein